MKKLLLLCSFIVLTISANAQSQRMVLLEEFAQASCAPCVGPNAAIHAYLNSTSSNVVQIAYQVWWPGFDPMYLHNTTEVTDRVNRYGVNAVPNSVIDGNQFNGAPLSASGGWTATNITNREAVSADFDINFTHTLSADLNTLNVNGTITATNAVSNPNLAYHVVVVEKHIAFPSPPGSTTEQDFYNVMKKFLPGTNGTALPGTITNGQSFTINESWVHANVYDLTQLAVIVFIQDNNTDEVMQAGYSENVGGLPALPVVDIAMTDVSTLPSDYCDYSATPAIRVENTTGTQIDNYEVSYTLNGGTPVSQLITTPLAANGTNVVTFPQITLAGGTDEIVFTVDINSHNTNVIDFSSLNNTLEIDPIQTLSSTANAAPLTIDFQGLAIGDPAPAGAIAVNPDNIRAFYVDNTITNTVNWNLGGFGNSNGCFRWDYYAISANQSSTLIFDKVDLSNTYNNYLDFAHAYAQYTSENDRLEVLISTDCGATWTTIFDEAGATLATRNAVNPARFYPAVDEWRQNHIDITAYDGQPEVVVAFRGTSAFGNSLYVDDIMTTGFVVSTKPQNDFASINVFPNPADGQLNIQMDLTEALDLNVEIVNALGQTVQPVSNTTFQSGQHNLSVNTSELPAGMYMVAIRNGNAYMNKRFVVVH